eukprot:jgi/Galph1/3251/GphlegSOOS_G1920.1
MSCDVDFLAVDSVGQRESLPVTDDGFQRRLSLKELVLSNSSEGETSCESQQLCGQARREMMPLGSSDRLVNSYLSCRTNDSGNWLKADNASYPSRPTHYACHDGCKHEIRHSCCHVAEHAVRERCSGSALRLENFTCPICLYVFYEPVTLRCSHTFCRSCVSQAVYGPLNMNSCPICRAELGLEPHDFAVNSLLASLVDDFFPLHRELSKRMHEERASDLTVDASVQKVLRRRPFTSRRVRRTMRNFGNLASVFLHPEVIIACLLVLSLSTLLLAMIAFLRGFHDVKNNAVPGTITAGIGPHISTTTYIASPLVFKRISEATNKQILDGWFVKTWLDKAYNSSTLQLLRKFFLF